MNRIVMALLVMVGGCASGAERAAQQEQRATRDAARFARATDGLVPGETRTCLDTQTRTVGSDVIGSRILYRESRARVWVTETGGGCGFGGPDPILVTRSFGGQLCRGDIIRAVDRTGGMLVGSCAAGDFTLYAPPKGDAS